MKSGSIMLDQMRCVDKKRLAGKIGGVQHNFMVKIKETIKKMLVD